MKKLLRNVLRSRWVQRAVGFLAAEYLRLVWLTNKFSFDPANVYEMVEPHQPLILAFWHGQHFLTPFIKRDDEQHRAKVLISRHRDGEVNARAAERLGIGTIRGSGAHNGEFQRKGGAGAFSEMLNSLKEGYNIALTADVPKVARVAGPGIVKLAQHSGRPIYAIAIASSRRLEFNNWDRTAFNLPFSRIAMVATEAIYVPGDAGDTVLESARKTLENNLNRATARAYDIVDRKGGAQP